MPWLSTLALALGTAAAEPVYELDPVVDGAILAATAVISLVEMRFLPLDAQSTPNCTLADSGLCDPDELHPLERFQSR